MSERPNGVVRVVCVDDNSLVVSALTARFEREPDVLVVASLPSADDLVRVAAEQDAHVVLLDLDMPGRDPFEALADLARTRPSTRTIILSGHARTELMDRAFEGGAWGFLSKASSGEAVLDAIRRVVRGDFAVGLE